MSTEWIDVAYGMFPVGHVNDVTMFTQLVGTTREESVPREVLHLGYFRWIEGKGKKVGVIPYATMVEVPLV